MSGAIELLPHLVEISSHRFACSRSLQSSANQLIAKSSRTAGISRRSSAPQQFLSRWPASSTAASSPHDAQGAPVALRGALATQNHRHSELGCTSSDRRHNSLQEPTSRRSLARRPSRLVLRENASAARQAGEGGSPAQQKNVSPSEALFGFPPVSCRFSVRHASRVRLRL